MTQNPPASGVNCFGVAGCLQSIIYIDNWSCDLNITNNVLDDCPGTKQGYYFFQVGTLPPPTRCLRHARRVAQ